MNNVVNLKRQLNELDKKKDGIDYEMDMLRRQIDVINHAFDIGTVMRYESGSRVIDFMIVSNKHLNIRKSLMSPSLFSGLVIDSNDVFWKVGTFIHFNLEDDSISEIHVPAITGGTNND